MLNKPDADNVAMIRLAEALQDDADKAHPDFGVGVGLGIRQSVLTRQSPPSERASTPHGQTLLEQADDMELSEIDRVLAGGKYGEETMQVIEHIRNLGAMTATERDNFYGAMEAELGDSIEIELAKAMKDALDREKPNA
jgi:hypothetical protein